MTPIPRASAAESARVNEARERQGRARLAAARDLQADPAAARTAARAIGNALRRPRADQGFALPSLIQIGIGAMLALSAAAALIAVSTSSARDLSETALVIPESPPPDKPGPLTAQSQTLSPAGPPARSQTGPQQCPPAAALPKFASNAQMETSQENDGQTYCSYRAGDSYICHRPAAADSPAAIAIAEPLTDTDTAADLRNQCLIAIGFHPPQKQAATPDCEAMPYDGRIAGGHRVLFAYATAEFYDTNYPHHRITRHPKDRRLQLCTQYEDRGFESYEGWNMNIKLIGWIADCRDLGLGSSKEIKIADSEDGSPYPIRDLTAEHARQIINRAADLCN